jgi:hypothetical protein
VSETIAPIGEMLTSTPPQDPTRRNLLKGIAALSTSVLFSGCNKALTMTASPTGQQIAVDPQPTPSGSSTQASLSVSANSAGSIGSGFVGLSYEKSALCEPLFTAANSDLIGLFTLLGPNVLRIGGNSVDQCVWTPDGPGQTAGQIAPSDVAALAAFVKATGWQVIYGINLGGAATGATTPELAAAEVAYAAKQLGSSLLGVEIGNECDGYGAVGSYFANNWSLAQFETLWEQFRSAILAVTPGVSITGPASGSNVSTWTIPFGQSLTKNNLSMLTQHYYRGDGHSSTSTAVNLIASDSKLVNCLSLLNGAAKEIGIPFRLAECNSYFDGGAVGVSNSYASALWVIDFLFNCAQGGAAGVNLHGGGDANGYAPIADNSGKVVEARPEFYGMTMFSLAGQGELYQTNLSVGQINATAYAVKTPSGGLNLVIVNKDTTQNLDLTISLPQTAGKATLTTMTQLSPNATAPSLSATSGVTIQDSPIAVNGAFAPSAPYSLSANGSQLNCYVPALSAVLIETV